MRSLKAQFFYQPIVIELTKLTFSFQKIIPIFSIFFTFKKLKVQKNQKCPSLTCGNTAIFHFYEATKKMGARMRITPKMEVVYRFCYVLTHKKKFQKNQNFQFQKFINLIYVLFNL